MLRAACCIIMPPINRMMLEECFVRYSWTLRGGALKLDMRFGEVGEGKMESSSRQEGTRESPPRPPIARGEKPQDLLGAKGKRREKDDQQLLRSFFFS